MEELITNQAEGTAPEVAQTLDELAREGARRLITAALEAEVEDYLMRLSHLRDERGHAVAVRNGKARERTVMLGAGAVKVHLSRTGEDVQKLPE